MTYLETIDYLYQLRIHGMKLGLDTMRALLAEMGDPHRNLRFIHIAGTNGKGSVAATLASVLKAAGYRTALYTSPHLISFCERFQINGAPAMEADIVRLVEVIKPCIERVAARPELRCPTFFEVVTAMAAKYFAEQKAEIVVWETGLGGRLDATNVVTPLVSVITEIGLDHTQYLGNIIAEIAREKAGIIKPGVPVVAGLSDAEAMAEISAVATLKKSRLVNPRETVQIQLVSESPEGQVLRVATSAHDYGEVRIPLLGEHQIFNCATSIAAVEALREAGITIEPDAVKRGLAQTRWPGRFQWVSGTPPIILDGAHNPQAAASLCVTLLKFCGDRPMTFVLGILRDKDCEAICSSLAPLAHEIYAVRVNSERTADPESLAELCRAANPAAIVHAAGSVSEALDTALLRHEHIVVVTGSLFLVGEAMQRLGLEPRFSGVTEKERTMQ